MLGFGVRAPGLPAPPKLLPGAIRPVCMPRSEQWVLRSQAGRRYVISVALPKAPAPPGGYPILYVLDPDSGFGTLVEAVRNQAVLFGPVVVVGIGYPDGTADRRRLLDLTLPAARARLPATLAPGWGAIGGADAFFRFIEDVLKPFIQSRISVDRSKQALFGDSLGGLFVLHVLFTNPDAFDTYIAGSPSIWWGSREILGEIPAFESLQIRSARHRRLLITVGGLERALAPEELRATLAMGLPHYDREYRKMDMVGNARRLAAELMPLTTHGLQVVFTVLPDETHSSAIPAYIGRGARFTLLGWDGKWIAGELARYRGRREHVRAH
jgi:ferri-bacillibactin esterase